MEKNGSPPAEFEFDDDHSFFMVRLPAKQAIADLMEAGLIEYTFPEKPNSRLQKYRRKAGEGNDCA